MGIAPVHIGLSVIIGEDGGIDVVPMLLLPDQWFTQRVAERSIGRIGHKHTDAMSVEWGIEVVLAVALYGLYGPGAVLAAAPREFLQ